MENRGWIRLHRKIMDNPFWLKEPFTPGQAWVDLLLLANHKAGIIWKRGIMIEVKRGQVGHSERTLAARWRWSRNRVKRFFRDLKTMQQIELETEPQNKNVTALITIVNYDLYQGNDTTNDTTDGATKEPQKGHKRYQNKNDKNGKKFISLEAGEVLSYLNGKTGRKYRNTRHIEARLKDGTMVDDCKRVIDSKITDPYFIQNPQYLNPETLFRPGNFDKYVNESIPLKPEHQKSSQGAACPKCGAQIPPQDLTADGCIHCNER